ncbi:methyltransferase domain-containing protein [Sinosporangium album]|uniref:methyltransferase domain-containing protein n=1 Tax=Sinosporangium album TaxID=504805 RepID=UPI003B8362D5
MSRDVWNPQTYHQFRDQRARPFRELISRVRVDNPSRVVDVGCGTGELTASLAERWPDARVQGFDSSPR